VIPSLPNPVTEVRVPLFLSPSHFGDLLRCGLSALAPGDVSGQLPVPPVALLGTVLHHVVTEVGEGRWGKARTAREAFEAILASVLSALDPGPVPLQTSVGRQRWFTRVSRARSWAMEGSPTASRGEPLPYRSSADAFEGPSEPRVDVGHEALIVWPLGRLRGRADLVERRAGGLRVVENKSGLVRDRAGALIEAIGLQVGLYALAIEEVTQEPVEAVVRGDEVIVVPWDASARRSLRALLEQTLAALPEDAVMQADAVASVGPHCSRCRLRPACARYLNDAAPLWVDERTRGSMPLDVWGEIRSLQETPEGVTAELRDDAGRFVVVGGLSPKWRVHTLQKGDRLYFFDLEAEQDRQHRERVQPSNFREAPPVTSTNRRRAFGLRVMVPR
jgi:hypothetical protein